MALRFPFPASPSLTFVSPFSLTFFPYRLLPTSLEWPCKRQGTPRYNVTTLNNVTEHKTVPDVTDTKPVSRPNVEYQILIASRDATLRQALGWLLSDEPGLRVVDEAASAIDLLSKAKALEPDVVILDVELPEADGYTVTRVLKRLPSAPFVILLLVHSDPTARQRAYDAGCDGIIERGTEWPDLLAQIRQLLKIGRE